MRKRCRVLLIDNYDSFTYNLYQFLGLLGADVITLRNDVSELRAVESLEFDCIVISPGPKAPSQAGLSKQMVRRFAPIRPILGVCLGHQAICEEYGARTVRAPAVVHGKTSLVFHSGKGVFAGTPSPLTAARYHSLISEGIPDELEVTAWTEDDVVMGVRHRDYRCEGVQFHPESFMTPHGLAILRNFVTAAISSG
jgi:anthranilate synthase/aminodeoxychorismate synthase-like glutamine amidotransferase